MKKPTHDEIIVTVFEMLEAGVEPFDLVSVLHAAVKAMSTD